MKKEIADQWIAALESGDYTQGRRKLRDSGDNFCCLGVLCNLHAIAHPEIAAKETHPKYYMGMYGTLATEVMKWADLRTRIGEYMENMQPCSLTSDNDNLKLDFSQIAKKIKKHWREL